ncbi:hypothetical protein BZG17_32785, partial [Escherichia coli]|nr:hypothetical protein [Escherichia coli]
MSNASVGVHSRTILHSDATQLTIGEVEEGTVNSKFGLINYGCIADVAEYNGPQICFDSMDKSPVMGILNVLSDSHI